MGDLEGGGEKEFGGNWKYCPGASSGHSSIGHFVGGQSPNENSAHEMAVFEVKVHVVCMDLQWSFQFQVTVINSSLWISGGET